jgi:Bacterial PH domain
VGLGGVPHHDRLVRWAKTGTHIGLEVVKRRAEQVRFAVIRGRWMVERTFAWIIKNRRSVRDCEQLTAVIETLIPIAATATLIRRSSSSQTRSYKAITSYSMETAGTLDIDSELKICTSGRAEPIQKTLKRGANIRGSRLPSRRVCERNGSRASLQSHPVSEEIRLLYGGLPAFDFSQQPRRRRDVGSHQRR